MADREADLIRDIGWNRAKNCFYRICYTMLKELQEIVQRTTDDLLLEYDTVNASNPFEKVRPEQAVDIRSRYRPEDIGADGSPYQHVTDIAARLKEELDRFSAREAAASDAWNELWDHPLTK